MKNYPLYYYRRLRHKITEGFAARDVQKRAVQFLGDAKAWASILNPTGVNVKNAMAQTAVYGAVSYLVTKISPLPINVYKRLEGGGVGIDRDHPLQRILRHKPNDKMNALQYQQFNIRAMTTNGNSFSFKHFKEGILKQLIPMIGPVEIVMEDGELIYYYTPNNPIPGQQRSRIRLRSIEVLHLRYMSKDGIVGVSPITEAAGIIGLSIELNKFATNFFLNGANPSAIMQLTAPENDASGELQSILDDDEKRAIHVAGLRKTMAGNDNSHKLQVIPFDFKLEQFGSNPSDSQALESRQFQGREIITNLYHLPPHKFGYGDPKYANAAEGNREAVNDGIVPWTTINDSSYSELLPESQQETHYVKTNLDALLRGSPKERAEIIYTLVKQAGIMTINEARELYDLPPVEGGDVIWVQLQNVPLTEQLDFYSSNAGERKIKKMLRFFETGEGQKLLAASNEDEKKKHVRNTAGQRVRNRLRDRYSPLFEDAAQQVVNREGIAIAKAIKKYLDKGDLTGFEQWMRDFYEKLPDFIKKKFRPVVTSYAEAIEEAALAEVDGEFDDDNQTAFENFVTSFLNASAIRYVNNSEGQIKDVLDEADADEQAEALTERVDEWHETRAGKIALRETVTGDCAFAIVAWGLVGTRKKGWITQGNPCVFCSQFAGMTVEITKSFVKKGTVLNSGSDEISDMKIYQSTAHPQLHGG